MSKTILVTVSDDRSKRKGGLYGATQDKMFDIFTQNKFVDEQAHWKIENIINSKNPSVKNFYQENKTMIDNTDAAKNGRLYKPFIIYETLEKLEEGDFLIYSDCSPEMWLMNKDWVIDKNIYAVEVIKELTVKNRDFLTAFVKWDKEFIPSGGLGIHTHNNFTMDSCIEKMKGEDQRYSYQCASGMICIRKTAITVGIVDNWLHYNRMPECSCMNVDETENSYFDGKAGSKTGNRHDQGILSMLLNQLNYDYVDIIYNDISPYNFLNFCRKDANYSFINSNIKT